MFVRMNVVYLITETTLYARVKVSEDFGVTSTVSYANIHSGKGINPFAEGQHKSFNGT